jgi:cytosine/adenosine deaminase-related metal-dependent hydrolase
MKPQYFNAHCHLELSHLCGAIPAGLPFVEWLRRLMPLKRATTAEESRAAAARALERMRDTGTTVLGDVLSLCTSEESIRAHMRSNPRFRAIFFWEMIEFGEAAGAASVGRCFARQGQCGPLPAHSVHGISPHAPYTTTGTLLRASAAVARMRGQWLCIHAAETREETELLLRGTGPMRELLAGVLTHEWKPPAMRPIAWLDACDCLGPRTLLVHCNDINQEDIRRIRARGASVVVCPGSHVYFARGEFPLARLLHAGVPVFLGTDSLASNDDVDMEREISLAAKLSPGVPRGTVAAIASADRAAAFLPAR